MIYTVKIDTRFTFHDFSLKHLKILCLLLSLCLGIGTVQQKTASQVERIKRADREAVD